MSAGSAARKLEAREVAFTPGEILMREGDRSGELWILREGEVEIYRERRGRVFVLAHLGPGEILGTMTATSGAPRTASVKALTPGRASVIPKDQVQSLLKGLPGWAHAFIKDLVARVTYANDLYIDTATAVIRHGSEESPLQFAARCAKTLVSLAEAVAVTRDGQSYVPLDTITGLLGPAVGAPEAAHGVVEVFVAEGLLPVAADVGPAPHVRLDAVVELAYFAEAVGKALAEQEPGTLFTMPLAANERKLLAELAQLAPGSDTAGDVVVDLKVFEESLRKQKRELKMEVVTRAHRLGLLVFDKSGSVPTLTFDPSWLALSIKAMNVMLKIAGPRAEADAKAKRTLLY